MKLSSITITLRERRRHESLIESVMIYQDFTVDSFGYLNFFLTIIFTTICKQYIKMTSLRS